MDKADEGGNIDKVLSKLDALGTRMDALETGSGSKNPLKKGDSRKADDDDDKKSDEFPPEDKDKKEDDAEEEDKDKKEDDEGEQDPDKKPPPPAADKKKDARKDQGASMPPPAAKAAPPPMSDKKKDKADDDDDDDDDKKGDDDDDDDKRRDAAAKADAVERRAMKKRLDAQDAEIKRLNALMRPRSDDEHAAFADAQAKADSVFAGFGKRAPRPLEGEALLTYRKRMATMLKSHSPTWSKVKFSQLPDAAFDIAEQTVYADATQAASNPTDLEEGELREVSVTDPRTGLKTNLFYGKDSFVKQMGRPARRVTGFRTQFAH